MHAQTAANNEMLLDSIIETSVDGKKYYKQEYTYDENGNELSETDYRWVDDSDGARWFWDDVEYYTYDSMGNTTSYEHFRTSKNEYTYDEQGNLIKTKMYGWSVGKNDWYLGGTLEYTYDDMGNKTEVHIDLMQETIPMHKYETTYDANGNVTAYAYYMWMDYRQQWYGRQKWEAAFDANGNEISYTGYSWDQSNWEWKKDGEVRYEYTFDAHGNPTFKVEYYWDDEKGTWEACEAEKPYEWKYTYDEQGNMTSKTYEDSFYGTSIKIEYSYDTMGNVICEAYNYLEGGAWICSCKLEYAYNSQGNKTMESYWYSDDTGGKHEYTYDEHEHIISTCFYNWANEAWNASYISTYYYRGHSTGICNIECDKDIKTGKRIENGNIVITCPDGRKFSITGIRIK